MAAMLDLVPAAFAGLRSSSQSPYSTVRLLPSSSSSTSAPSYSSSSSSSFCSVIRFVENGGKCLNRRRNGGKLSVKVGVCRAMVHEPVQGASAIYAKEMERLSAKEALLLAFKDSGGFESLVTGKMTDMQRIDVNERITSLERLNPTPRPTTSPLLVGNWSYEWFGNGSPVFFLAKFISERFPSSLATLLGMDTIIKDGYSRATAKMKFLNSIETKFVLILKLSVEGPLRMSEEYSEGVLEIPTISEGAVPEQLKGTFDQAVNTMQQLPVPIKDVVTSGLKIPLSGTYRRLIMISYLDEEILILRDANGVPEVLARLDDQAGSTAEEPFTEYES